MDSSTSARNETSSVAMPSVLATDSAATSPLMYMTSGHGCAASATGASGMTRVVPDVEPGTSANIATTSTTAVVSLFSVTSSWSPTSTTSTRPLSTAAGAPDSVGPDSAANTSGRPGADAVP